MIVAENHLDVYLKNGECLTLSKLNPAFVSYQERLAFSMKYNEPVGTIVSPKGEIKTVFSSEYGIVSSLFVADGYCKVSMMPLAGIYLLPTSHDEYESIHADLTTSQKDRKRIRVFLRQGSAEIVDVRLD